jgi:hypothetical protein
MALALAALAVLFFVVAGPGTRLGAWTFVTGFQLIRWGFYLGILACVLAVIAALITRPLRPQVPLLIGALVLGGFTILFPLSILRRARSIPPIHDVTTDTDDPPVFVAVLPLRANAPNKAEYGGPEVAAAQKKGYPDLGPLELEAPPAAVFPRAVAAARGMGWDIVATDSTDGRVEATATTPFFGFKDDVVVRIRPRESGSRVDVRSVSRVGGGDIGTNARRIKQYLVRLRSP